MNEAAHDLKNRVIAKLKDGKRYTLHRCSMCNYPCKWFVVSTELYYDAGCDCSYRPPDVRQWDELDFYFDPNNGHIDDFEKWLGEPDK